MTHSLHAAHYADRALQCAAKIVENVEVARDTRRLRLECPKIARRIVPGQFLMVRLPERSDPLIGRPLALYDTCLSSSGEAIGIDVVYLVGGKFTRSLAEMPAGKSVDIWGPLGNGFEPQPTDHLIMAAGGIGHTPFLALGREYLGRGRYGDPSRSVTPASRVTFCYGATTADLLAPVDDFKQIGCEVRLATDDGSCGRHGLVTDLVADVLAESDASCRIACCGPVPMMEAVSRMAIAAGVPCQVSLETPMACGIGICSTCVAKIRDEAGNWDYRRTCVEGPVFDARLVQW